MSVPSECALSVANVHRCLTDPRVPRLDPAALAAAPQPADWGSRCRDGAALRIRADGPHDAAAVARRSWLRSAQPADRHVLAGRAGLAGPAKAGVLRRSGRAATSGSRRRERRHHVFAADPWLELVELVHGGWQAHPAGCSHDGPAQCGNRSGERDLLRHAEDPRHQGALVRPVRHARLSARRHHQCQSGQPVLESAGRDEPVRLRPQGRRSDRAADPAERRQSDRGLRPVAHHRRRRRRRQAARPRSGHAATDLPAGRPADPDDGICGRPHEGHGLHSSIETAIRDPIVRCPFSTTARSIRS